MPVPEEMSRDELIALARRQDTQISAMASRISELLEVNEALEAGHVNQVAELTAVHNDLAARLAKLEHLLSRNSGNCSLPPSRDDDPGRTPPPAKPECGGGPKRKLGKQPGASGANLAWTEDPTRRVDRFPQGRCECGGDLADAADLGIVDRSSTRSRRCR